MSSLSRRRRRLIPFAVAAVVALVVGVASGGGHDPGPLHWVGVPRAGTAGDQQLLYGTVVNRGKTPVRIRTDGVRVLGGDGRRLTATAAFAGGYVPAYAGNAPAATLVLPPRARVPLSVAWQGDATTIAIAGSKLAVPK